MNPENYKTLAYFIVQTLTNLVSRSAHILVHDADTYGNNHIEVHVQGKPTAHLLLAQKDCMSLLDAPTSESSIDLLELITNEIGITLEDTNLAKELNAFRDPIIPR